MFRRKYYVPIIVILFIAISCWLFRMDSLMRTLNEDIRNYKNNVDTINIGETMVVSGTGNSTVVYDHVALREQLLNLHSMLYKVSPGEQCEVREPKCIVLGVSKCGTQELVDFASLHPNIVLKPDVVPARMFHENEAVRMLHMTEKRFPMPCSYPDQIAIAKADDFLYKHEMPEMLYKFNPKLKMILMVREPVARMKSGFTFVHFQRIQNKEVFNYKPEELPEMDKWFINISTGEVLKNREEFLSTYYSGLERYLKWFPLNQILVIESNELKNDPVRVLKRMEDFLHLKPIFSDKLFKHVKEKGFYCLHTDRTYCYGSDRGRAVMPDLKPETMAIMKTHFKPTNEKFFKLIGKEFDW